MINKKILIAIGIIAAILASVVVYLSTQNTPDPVTETHPKDTVTLKDNQNYISQLDASEIESSIKSELLYQVRHNSNKSVASISASIRDNSFTKSINQFDGTPTYTFLTDIDSLEQTYKIQFSGGDEYNQAILYVVCPSPEEMKYPSFTCKDREGL